MILIKLLRLVLVMEMTSVKQILLMLVLAWAAVPLAGCNLVGGSQPEVLATTTILADLAKQVAGDRLRVGSVVPVGAHVEEYEPTPDDAKRVSGAKILIVNGLDLDKWADPLLKNKKADAPVITLTEGLPDLAGNPHMWFDPQLARKYVEKIRDALVALDPQGKDGYTTRAKAYDAALVSLDTELKTKAATVPQARRKLVTSHDAFPYFAKAFGFEVVGFVQPQPDKEPSAKELAKLVDTVKAAKVPAVFVEAGTSKSLTETLAKEAGVSKVITDLPTDSILAAPADSYLGLMRVTMDKVTSALR
jgi:ABC-type Zn uptake system ZnuABC Zn-binding protein ZnuA